jgi:hypothetical protein
MCLDFLITAGKPMTAVDIFAGVNDTNGAIFGHPSYVRMLLENLRTNRIVFGKRNPESKLGHGMPHHPRLYSPLPYQQALLGSPSDLAASAAAWKVKNIARAYKRLKNSKSPYPIFRKKAEFSSFQYAQAQEAMDALTLKLAISLST